jgi:hypothetical protein
MGKALKYKDINLIAAQDRRLKVAKEERAVAVRQPMLILILVLLLLGLGYYYLHAQTIVLEKEKNRLVDYLNDPITIADHNESLKLQDAALRMVAQKDELERVLLNISSYPDIQGGHFHTIYEYASGRIDISNVRYDRTKGVLSFNAVSDTVTGVPIFVAQLRMSYIFEDIKYEGYTEQVQSFSESLPPKPEPRRDEYGNQVINPITEEPVYDLIPQTRSWTVRSYAFAVTALVKAPEPSLPGPGMSLIGNDY